MNFRFLLYPARVIKQIVYLPKIVYKQNKSIEKLEKVLHDITDISSLLQKNTANISELNKTVQSMEGRITRLKNTEIVNNTVSDNHSLDDFYKLFEDRFRGTEEATKIRISDYKPLFESLPNKIRKKPVIDLGCGRGEFLSFAKDIGLNAVGIDMNGSMVNRARSMGYVAQEIDALTYMLQQKTNSLAAITGFHIVEHIPFEILMELFRECYRSLSHSGFVLFETPNPKNIIVGTNNFYIDPSHIKPIPPELLSFALESTGFITEIMYKHPARDVIEHEDKEVFSIMHELYGPQDYAVIARKP